MEIAMKWRLFIAATMMSIQLNFKKEIYAIEFDKLNTFTWSDLDNVVGEEIKNETVDEIVLDEVYAAEKALLNDDVDFAAQYLSGALDTIMKKYKELETKENHQEEDEILVRSRVMLENILHVIEHKILQDIKREIEQKFEQLYELSQRYSLLYDDFEEIDSDQQEEFEENVDVWRVHSNEFNNKKSGDDEFDIELDDDDNEYDDEEPTSKKQKITVVIDEDETE